MKTIFQYLLLTAACAALGACQDFSDDTAFTPETPELSFVETSITAEKATKDYELSIKSNLPWRIECDKDWVSFDPSYGQGDATITVTVAANRTLDERTATISAYVIKGENVTLPVTQAAASASDLATHYYVKTDGSADKDGLTWETATTLANAIDQAMNGDVIHVAAGSYVPSVPLTGMKTALDNTFEIHSNFSMIGGYPADAAEGAVADPVANETILDGDHAVCHVVAVTAAKMNGMKASLDGFTIKNGSSQFSTVGSTTIGGVKFYQSYGSGHFHRQRDGGHPQLQDRRQYGHPHGRHPCRRRSRGVVRQLRGCRQCDQVDDDVQLRRPVGRRSQTAADQQLYVQQQQGVGRSSLYLRLRRHGRQDQCADQQHHDFGQQRQSRACDPKRRRYLRPQKTATW